MNTLKARVVNGRLTLDQPCDLPEGTELELVIADESDTLDDEERAELHSSLDRAWKRLQAGEPGTPVDEFVDELLKDR